MWTCPRCKHKFFNKNQHHSCGSYSLDDFLFGKSPVSIRLFRAFLNRYSEIGSYELHPVKTRVALLKKMRFASVNRLGQDYLEGHLVLTDEANDKIFHRIENINNRFYVHNFRIFKLKDIDPLIKYMKLAYKTGLREHVIQKNK